MQGSKSNSQDGVMKDLNPRFNEEMDNQTEIPEGS